MKLIPTMLMSSWYYILNNLDRIPYGKTVKIDGNLFDAQMIYIILRTELLMQNTLCMN